MCLQNVYLHASRIKSSGEMGIRDTVFLRSARLKIEIEVRNNPTIKILLHYYILFYFIYFYLIIMYLFVIWNAR